MKKWTSMLLVTMLLLTGCTAGGQAESTGPKEPEVLAAQSSGQPSEAGETVIFLSDEEIVIDTKNAYDQDSVYVGRDIVFYEAGQGISYGEGDSEDAHMAEEANTHQVVHITKPGTYRIKGKISAGQIAVDLGEDAKNDPNGVVTLILDGADITCTVAPAVIFYNVYECGEVNAEKASPVADTSAAGANVVIAEGSVNIVSGSYVAKIYKPGTVELNKAGTEVEEAKKLHKYDAAFYSKMSMNVDGGGILVIHAENEGLGSELHLTINGGDIRIRSGNDGINTNEDNVSVTTINSGNLNITVTGTTGEGDGIDSNGYVVINGGTVIASACSFSGDAGLDSDRGIYINGGTVVATGHMFDHIAGGDGTYAVFQFVSTQKTGNVYTLKDEAGTEVLQIAPENHFTYLVISTEDLVPGDYSLWMGEKRLSGNGGFQGFGGMPGQVPGKIEKDPPEGDYEIPPQPTMPMVPQGSGTPGNIPQGNPPDRPEGGQGRPGAGGFGQMMPVGETKDTFTIVKGGNYFTIVAQ